MRARVYLAWLVGSFLLLGAVVAALNALVDPYRMFGTPAVVGWTALKPRIYEQIGIAKTYQLERIKPVTVLLGNSRVEVGINPDSPVWRAAAQPVFNAAEAGTGPFTALLMLREAIAAGRLRTAIVGIDFLDFLQHATDPATRLPAVGPDERRLLVDRDGRPNAQRWRQEWRDGLIATLSADALFDSISTLMDQDPTTSATITPEGFNPLNEYRVFTERSGYHELFAQKNMIYETQYRTYPHPDFADPARFASFRYLFAILKAAAEARVDLVLYIHPYHADYLEMLHRVGLWPAFENWKRALAGVADDAHVALFDFADYDTYSTEPVPPPGDRHKEMRWYWESGHYKSALGDRMLQVMLEGRTGFGHVLTPATVSAVLAQVRADRTRTICGETAASAGPCAGASPVDAPEAPFAEQR